MLSGNLDGESQFECYHYSLCSGIQGNDIGDVKFNSDGDGLGRYSVYQYQQVNQEKHVDLSTPGTQAETRGWEYNWIGEFGEKDNFRWDKVNDTGLCLLIYRGLVKITHP